MENDMRCFAASFLAATGILALASMTSAMAQEAPAAAETVEAVVAAVPNPGNTAWMLTATILVLLMTLPGLALFYGGLVRAKNMLSVLMQVTMIASVVMIVWVVYGYTMAFGDGGNAFIAGFGKMFLAGVTPDSTAATFTDEVIPEYVFIAFQMTFAAITPALIVGAFAERIKFSAVVLFSIIWVTLVYFPVAHMVWAGSGLIFNWGALDFAGGTVVHINAGIAALVGCIMIGKRAGYPKEMMPPHSMSFTMVGASLLWVGWFGFNAGSNLEANGGAALVMMNTFTATAGAIVAWAAIEGVVRGKASMLGAASGLVAGLVAVTPACGTVGPVGAILLGAIASAACYFFVAVVKPRVGYDDSLDVFGIHGIGGIVGAIGTGILTAPSLGGTGAGDFSIAAQTWMQFLAVCVTIVWCAVGSAVAYFIVNMIVGLRPAPDAEREGLDLTSHGEMAYHTS
jgi:Amt family ammonium transporter